MFGGVGTPTLDDAFPQPSETSMLHGRILIQRMCGGGVFVHVFSLKTINELLSI